MMTKMYADSDMSNCSPIEISPSSSLQSSASQLSYTGSNSVSSNFNFSAQYSTCSGGSYTPQPPVHNNMYVPEAANPVPGFMFNGVTPNGAPSYGQDSMLTLLNNELNLRRISNSMIQSRLVKDRQQFEKIEAIFHAKISKYESIIQRSLQKMGCAVDHTQIRRLLDEIVDTEYKCNEIDAELRKKKWYEDKNEMYRLISSNTAVMDEIDHVTQQIDYWQQMLCNSSQNGTENQSCNNNNNINNSINKDSAQAHSKSQVHPQSQENQATASFVMKEALRIKHENEKTLHDLRQQLDDIRANRAQPILQHK